MSDGRDEDRAWAELVDAFHTEPEPADDDVQRWPAAEDVDDDKSWHDDGSMGDTADPYYSTSRTPGISPGLDPSDAGRHPSSPDPDSGAAYVTDDDHFVPPNPPPIPRGDRITRWAWAGLITAPSALLLFSILGWSPPDELMMLLIGGFIAGFGTLVARMRGRSPHDPDNGAVV